MNKRILLAGVLGGLAMFIWSSIAHMVLPLGEVGIREFPHDEALLKGMQSRLGQTSGLYLFPARDQLQASNPSGILIYHPSTAMELTPGQLITEFATEFAEALLLAWLLAHTRLSSYLSLLGFTAIVAVMGALVTNVSYWNWYGFPSSYTLAYMGTEIVGLLVAGAVAARFVLPTIPRALSAAATP
ncbi:MAG TPA: hypothetical protein VKU01_22095 [Bryobacteraceae bacterium]|nr:hypothetical protein [Bryobacteraceae bacterium]